MIVGKIMTHNPFTVKTDTPVTDAQALMRREHIHRLPVLDKHHKLVGIVSEKDLLYASPSPATTLNVYEMSNLLSKLTVESVMTHEVVVVHEETVIEDAARDMVDNDIGGLPVVRGDQVVGIVTESDIFKRFIELFGTRTKGIRISMLAPEKPGELAELTTAIANNGGNIISFGTFLGDDPSNLLCIIKVENMSKDEILQTLKPLVVEVLDAREV